jgi:hypothetical protein
VVLVQVDVTPCNNCKLPQEVGAGSVLFGKDSGQVLGWRKYMKLTTRLLGDEWWTSPPEGAS